MVLRYWQNNALIWLSLDCKTGLVIEDVIEFKIPQQLLQVNELPFWHWPKSILCTNPILFYHTVCRCIIGLSVAQRRYALMTGY